MNKYWRDIFKTLDILGEPYNPIYKRYICTDPVTMSEGYKIGDIIEFREKPILNTIIKG